MLAIISITIASTSLMVAVAVSSSLLRWAILKYEDLVEVRVLWNIAGVTIGS